MKLIDLPCTFICKHDTKLVDLPYIFTCKYVTELDIFTLYVYPYVNTTQRNQYKLFNHDITVYLND